MTQEELFQTIELIAERKLSEADYTKTKIGIIKGKTDKGYLVQVENAEIEAIAADNNQAYALGESVYVAVQNNVNKETPHLIISHTEGRKNKMVWIGDGQVGKSSETPEPGPILIEKNIQSNGEYYAFSDNAQGYSKVTVEVPTPPDPTLITKEITQNGEYTALSDSADGYEKVIVNTPPPSVLTTRTAVVNGTYNATDDNADGYSSFKVQVPPPVLQNKNITENGIYTPSSGVDGFNEVEVNVQPTLIEETFYENGTFTPPSGVDGWDEVNINIESGYNIKSKLNHAILLNTEQKPIDAKFNQCVLETVSNIHDPSTVSGDISGTTGKYDYDHNTGCYIEALTAIMDQCYTELCKFFPISSIEKAYDFIPTSWTAISPRYGWIKVHLADGRYIMICSDGLGNNRLWYKIVNNNYTDRNTYPSEMNSGAGQLTGIRLTSHVDDTGPVRMYYADYSGDYLAALTFNNFCGLYVDYGLGPQWSGYFIKDEDENIYEYFLGGSWNDDSSRVFAIKNNITLIDSQEQKCLSFPQSYGASDVNYQNINDKYGINTGIFSGTAPNNLQLFELDGIECIFLGGGAYMKGV